MILDCCVCAMPAPALRQWSNRDIGYGVCSVCFAEAIEREGLERALELYGVPGVHHSVPDQDAGANHQGIDKL